MPRRSRTKTQPTLTPLDERAVPAVIEGVEINSEPTLRSTDDSVNVIMTTSASNETITLTPHTTTVLDDGKVSSPVPWIGTFKGVEGAQETLLGVVRLLADGKIDSSFNDGQIQTLAAGSKQAATVRQVLTDSAGRVTLFGTTYDVPNIPGPHRVTS